MAKDVFSRFSPVALVATGWLSFGAGILLEGPAVLELLLLAVARVLPQALDSAC
jgi:hypothetical protein